MMKIELTIPWFCLILRLLISEFQNYKLKQNCQRLYKKQNYKKMRISIIKQSSSEDIKILSK